MTKGNEIQKQRHIDESCKNRERWKAMGSEDGKSSSSNIFGLCATQRTLCKIQSDQHVNSVRLDDDEVANIIWVLMVLARRPFCTTGWREVRVPPYRQSRVTQI